MKTRAVLSLLGAILLSACASTGPIYLTPYPGSYFTVSVRAGESLKAVAERFRVKEDDLLALNKIDNRASLAGGQIRIPAYGWDRDPVGGVMRPVAPRQEPPRQEAPRQQATAQPTTRVEARALDAPPVTSTRQTRATGNASSQPQQSAPSAQPAAQASSWSDMFTAMQPQANPEQKFLWPVNGRVISPFGQTVGGGRNDGINISAKLGTPVHAADAGTVTYVGNELRGYGNLILIQHDNGYVTAYAHAERIDVQRGDRVARGQVIGSAGETGNVTEPQLHFELRLGTRPVDPTHYLVASK